MKKIILFIGTVITLFLLSCSTNEPPQVHKVCGVENKTKGIDVSHHQGVINWPVVASTEYKFAFIRVSDGARIIDRQFQTNWKSAKDNNIMRGAYQFFRPEQDATEQAQVFLENIEKAGGMTNEDLPPVIDIETIGTEELRISVASVKEWIDYVELHTNRHPIIYTGPSFWDSNKLGNSFSNYPLWTAHYTGATCPLAPDAWSQWTFWQFTGSGKTDGITTVVDQNVYNGDFEELKLFVYNSFISSITSTQDASVDSIADITSEDSIADITPEDSEDAKLIDYYAEYIIAADAADEEVLEAYDAKIDVVEECETSNRYQSGCSCSVVGK